MYSVIKPTIAQKAARVSVRTKATETSNSVVPPSTLPADAPLAKELASTPIQPAIDFLSSTEFKATETDFYKDVFLPIVESPFIKESTGFTPTAEIINGRGAMLGFLLMGLTELFTQKDVLQQFAANPLSVLLTMVVISVATIIPIKKGTEGDYMEALKEASINLPAGVFTENMERVHGRLAMLGFLGFLTIEVVSNHAVL